MLKVGLKQSTISQMGSKKKVFWIRDVFCAQHLTVRNANHISNHDFGAVNFSHWFFSMRRMKVR